MQPEQFGKYILLERLAAGGMGEIFLAKAGPRGFERHFAIKRILTQHADTEEFVQMLFREAKLSVGLVHPNIAQVFEFGSIQGCFFLAMEYVEGLSLVQLISASIKAGMRLPHADALAIGIQLCRALDYAHNKQDTNGSPLGIIHRDISPQNVIIDINGTAKLIDFGIAKAAGSANLTEAGSIKGKLAYMAPEQARGEDIDRRSDLYAVGVLMFECLAFQRLFPPCEDIKQLARVQRGVSFNVQEALPSELPTCVKDAVAKALAADLSARYSSAGEFERDLSRGRNEIDSSYTPHGLARLVRQLDADREARLQRLKQYASIESANILETAVAGANTIQAALAREDSDPAGQTVATNPTAITDYPEAELSVSLETPTRTPYRMILLATGLAVLGLGVFEAWRLLWRNPQRPTVAATPASNPMLSAAAAEAASPKPLANRTTTRTVRLITTPKGASVEINNEARGKTPLKLDDLALNQDLVVLFRKKGFEPVRRTLAAGDATTNTLRVRLQHSKGKVRPQKPKSGKVASAEKPALVPSKPTGCVSIVVEPWAHVMMAGKRLGTTPIKCLRLPEGPQTLKLTNPASGLSKTIHVSVKAAATVHVFEQLMDR